MDSHPDLYFYLNRAMKPPSDSLLVLNESSGSDPYSRKTSDAASMTARFDSFFLGVFMQLPEPCFLTDASGNITFFNTAAASLTGFDTGQRHSFLHLLDEVASVIMASMLRQQQAVETAPLKMKASKGEVWCKCKISPLDLPGLHEKVMLIQLADVRNSAPWIETGSIRALALAIECIPLPVFVKDKYLVYTACNQVFCDMLGKKREEIIGRNTLELCPAQYAQTYVNADKELQTSGPVQIYEAEVPFGDGQVHNMLFLKTLIKDKRGDFEGIVGIMLDITERRNVEELLSQHEDTFRELLLNQGEGMAIVDEDEIIILANPASERIFSVEPGSLEGRNLDEFIIPEDRQRIKDETLKRKNKETSTYEVGIVDAKGHCKHLLVTATPHFDRKHHFVGTIGIFRDITGRKHHERALRDSKEKLMQMNQHKDRLISVLAHDLRNPLHSMLGFSELLLLHGENYDAQKRKEYQQYIYHTISTTCVVLENLLDWVKYQRKIMRFDPQIFNLHDLLSECVGAVQPQAYIKNIHLVNQSSHSVWVIADRSAIEIVTRNLLSNAIKFSDEGGHVTLGITETNDEVSVMVCDEGVGIAQAEIETLFDENRNKSTAGTMGEKGVGLGLYLCKELVEKSEGQITVESQVGKGTCFCFTLKKSRQLKKPGKYS